jgi:methylmalonyl-CoA mutase N-terminal domain/subunit
MSDAQQEKRSGADIEEVELPTGIKIKTVYGPEDIAHLDYKQDIGDPGQYPYLRGPYPTMYRGRKWTKRLYAGFGTSEDTNRRFKFLLEHGQTGLSMALDLPTQLGMDSDDPLAEADVGRVGVAIDSLKDMEGVFEGIDLGKISTSFTINSTAAILLAMYIAVGDKQGVPQNKLTGTIQNDILKEYVARGTWIFPIEPSIRLIGDTIEYCANHIPKFNSISLSGPHMREAGATSVQELAYTFGNAKEYINEVLRRGYKIDDFAPNLSFIFCNRDNFFEEICKYRAARRIWARIMKEDFGAQNPKSMMLRFAGGGGGLCMTKNQPKLNIARSTLVALSSVLGGAQSILLAAYDEAYAIPTEESARLALMIQNLLGEEVGVADTVDPLAGSYFVESLTDEIEKKTWETMDRIEALGGMVKAIKAGYIQRELSREAYSEEMRIQSGEKIKIGLNKYVVEEDEEEEMELHETPLETIQKQIDRTKEVKAERDRGKVDEALIALAEAAKGTENLMPHLVNAVKAYATVGEIVATFKSVFGTYHEITGV